MATPVEAKSFSNVSAATPAAQLTFALKGGVYLLATVATFGGGSVELVSLGPDQSTFLSLPTPAKLTANGIISTSYISPGTYKLLITTATGVFATVAGTPLS